MVVVSRDPVRPAPAARPLDRWGVTPPESVTMARQEAAAELGRDPQGDADEPLACSVGVGRHPRRVELHLRSRRGLRRKRPVAGGDHRPAVAALEARAGMDPGPSRRERLSVNGSRPLGAQPLSTRGACAVVVAVPSRPRSPPFRRHSTVRLTLFCSR